jgi:phytoene dehydrogenase-like protein
MDRCGLTGLPRGVLGGMSAVLAMDPETCPFHLYSGYVSTSLSGAWRAEGGGEAITAPLVARLGELGGKLLLKQGAARIHWQDREATAVEDEKGVQHPCDMVIATCHPQETMRLVGPGGLRPSLEERIPVIPDSNSAVLAYAALSRPPTCLGQSHHFSRIGEDGYLYYLAPSNFVPPAHDHPPYLEAMLWVPCDSVAAWRDSSPAHRPEAYQAWKRQQERQLLDAVIAQFPELAGTVTKTWSATPLTIERYVRSRHGAAIGLSHDLAYLGNDPLPRRSRLKNLCFAGQSIGHAGVVGCLIDGFILLQFILERDLRAEVMAGTGPSR